jgi:hypothetical protein
MMTTAAAEPTTVTCYQVDLTKPGDPFRHGLVYRSLVAAKRKATELGSTVTTIDVFADIAAELPE